MGGDGRGSRSEEPEIVEPEALDASIRADQAQMLAEGQSVLVFNAVNAAIVHGLQQDGWQAEEPALQPSQPAR